MIYLVQPPRGRSISGGYRFNDEMVRRLEADGIGRSIQMQGVFERILTPADVLVVDSVFLWDGHLENLEELNCPSSPAIVKCWVALVPDARRMEDFKRFTALETEPENDPTRLCLV